MVLENDVQKAIIDEAIQSLEVATSLRPDNPEYFYYLGKSYALGQFHSKAVSALQRTVALDQTHAEYYYLLSRELKTTGSIDDAKTYLNRAISLNHLYRDAFLLMAEIFFGEKNWQETASNSRSALGISWDDSAFSMLIASLSHSRKYPDIVDEKAKARNFTVSAKSQSTAFYIARALSQTNRWQEARDFYSALTPYCPGPEVPYYHGCAYAHEARYEDAYALFSQIIQGSNYNLHPRYYLQRGHVLVKLQKIQEAVADYNIAYQTNPNDPEILFTLAKWDLYAGHYQKAMDYIARALAQNNPLGKFHLMKGLIHEQRNEIDDAISAYNLAIETQNTPLIQKRLGIAYTKKGCNDEALQHLANAKTSGDVTDSLQYYLAFNHAQTGCYQPAVEIWRELSGRSSDSGLQESLNTAITSANYLLGRSFVEANNYSAAITAWETYCQSVPGDEVTKNNIAELYFRKALMEISSSQRNEESAAPLLRKAYGLHSSDVISLYLSILNLRLGNVSIALPILTTLQQNNPGDERIRYYFSLGSFMNNNGNAIPVPGTGSPGSYQDAFRSLQVWHDIKVQNWAGITSLLAYQFEDGGVPQQDDNAFWLCSYTTALIQTGEYVKAGELIDKYLSSNELPYALYLKALHHTHNHRYSESLAELEKLLTADPKHKNGKELATKLLLTRISKNIAANHLDAITADIDLLLRLHPGGLDQLAGASSLKNYLPIVYMKGQKREECARIWEEELIQHPENSEILHSLAVLYYWWAIDEEDRYIEKDLQTDEPKLLSSLWIKSISYLVMLKYAREFWELWKTKRESACSRPDVPFTIPSEHLIALRNKPIERLHKELQKRFTGYHDKGWINASERIDRYIMLLDLEQSSASKFNLFLTTYQDRIRDQPHFEVCGNSMITFLKMRNDLDSLITLARNRFPDDPLIDELAILMSPFGYTHMLIQRNRLDRALEHYYTLPEQIRLSPDGRTILTQVYLKKIELALNSDYPESATEPFKEVSRISSEMSTLNKVADDISQKLFEKTNLLDSREKHQEGIKILEQFLEDMNEVERRAPRVSLNTVRTNVKEHLAALYTNYGWKPMQQKKFDVAENAFMKALQYNPGYQRAKDGLSTIFHNKGTEKLTNNDIDGGITLLEKALSYQDDITTRKILAIAYAQKAVALSQSRYAGGFEVLSQLRKANAMDPSNKEIVDALNLVIGQMRGRY